MGCRSSKVTSSGPTLKLLLLGGANVGKSTIFKQMKLLYLTGFTDEEREQGKLTIYKNILETLYELESLAEKHNFELLSKNQDIIDEIKPTMLTLDSTTTTASFQNLDIWGKVESLWEDPVIQDLLKKMQKGELEQEYASSAHIQNVMELDYFLSQLGTIKQNDYIPSDADMLRLRRSTAGSHCIEFDMKVRNLLGKVTPVHVVCNDVGGQTHEQLEWGKHSEDLSAIIYIASLSEYNSYLNGNNVLRSQIELFHKVLSSECFNDVVSVVLLNKSDLFEKKLETIPLKDHFPNYEGSNDAEEAFRYFEDLFMQTAKDAPNGQVTTGIMCTCATDTQLMNGIIGTISEAILHRTLNDPAIFG